TPLSFDGTNTLTAPGVLYSGGTPPVDLGTAVANSIVAGSTSGSVCSPTGVVVAGGLHYASGTLTDGAFSCPSNQWVSSTSTSGPACTQIAVGNLQNIAAHTIVANGTALAAPPAQTSIGTTEAFDGTGQLQCVGLRDGGGVNHVTTGTWPISSVIETDVSGNLAAEAQLACGQSEGPWTGDARKSAGSCAVTNVAITETSGPTSLTIGAIPDISGQNDVLVRPGGTSTVVGIAAKTVLNAIAPWSENVYWEFFVEGVETLEWLYFNQESSTPVEFPPSFAATTAFLNVNLIAAPASNTLAVYVTRNGTTLTNISFTSASALGVHATSVAVTGGSVTDTYGIAFSTTGAMTPAFTASIYLR